MQYAPISVIIPTLGCTQHLLSLLPALLQSDKPPAEVIVVDDGSADDFNELPQHDLIKLIRLPRQLGPAIARNTGAAKASQDWLLFIDSDVILVPELVPRLAEIIGVDSDFAAINVLNSPVKAKLNFAAKYNLAFEQFWMAPFLREKNGYLNVQAFWTRTGLIKKTVFDELGGIDVSFTKPTVEDLEFSYRFGQNYSARVYGDLTVAHIPRSTLRATAVKYYRTGWDLARLYRRYHGFSRYFFTPRETARNLSGVLLIIIAIAGFFLPWLWYLLVPAVPLFLVVNADMLRSFSRFGGWSFALAAVAIRLPLGCVVALGSTLGMCAQFLRPARKK